MMRSKKQRQTAERAAMRISLKGLAMLAAVDSGLLPEIEIDGKRGYNALLFNKFWAKFITFAENNGFDPLGNKSGNDSKERG